MQQMYSTELTRGSRFRNGTFGSILLFFWTLQSHTLLFKGYLRHVFLHNIILTVFNSLNIDLNNMINFTWTSLVKSGIIFFIYFLNCLCLNNLQEPFIKAFAHQMIHKSYFLSEFIGDTHDLLFCYHYKSSLYHQNGLSFSIKIFQLVLSTQNLSIISILI